MSRRDVKTVALLAAVGLSLLLALAAGCGGEGEAPSPAKGGPQPATGREIILTTLAQGAVSEFGRFDEMPPPEDAPPECLVITDGEEYQRLLSQAFPEQPAGEVDFGRYIVLAAMQGPKNTAGYAISIVRAEQNGARVVVEVEVVEPPPGSATAQVLTSPFHLTLAERSDFDPRGEIEFTFFDQDYNQISQQPAEI